MSHVNSVNNFFDRRYKNYLDFGAAPLQYLFYGPWRDYNGDPITLIFRTIFTPILAPIAFLVTLPIALCLALATAVVHVLSLAVAGLVDGLSPGEATDAPATGFAM